MYYLCLDQSNMHTLYQRIKKKLRDSFQYFTEPTGKRLYLRDF